MSTELGTAYVTVMPSMSKFGPAMLKGVNKISADGGKASATSFGEGLIGGIKGIGIGTAIGNLISTAAGVIASSVGSAVARVDQLSNFPRVMQNLGYGADEATEAIGRMSAGIDGLPTSLDGIASATTKIAPLTGSLGKATEISLALNNALLAGGKDAQTQANALEQFSQMLAVGKVDMAAWRSMVSAMPGQLDQLSVALLGAGHSNMDLYEAMKNGSVTFDQFNDALLDLNANGVAGFASFEEQARTATQGIGTAVENAKNRVSKALALVIDEIGQGNIAGAINGVTSQFGTMAGFVVDGIKSIKDTINTSSIASSFTGIGKSVEAIAGSLRGAFSSIGERLGGVFTKVGTSFGSFFSRVAETLPGVIDQLAPLIENIAQLMGDRLAAAFEIATPLVEPFAAVLGTVLDVASSLVGALDRVYVYVGEYLANALSEVDFSPLYDALGGVSALVDGIDLSPLTDAVYDTLDAWGGLIGSIDLAPIGDAARQAADGFVAFGEAIAPAASAITDFVTGHGPAFEGMVQRIQDHVGQFGGVWDNLATAFGNLGDALVPVVNVLGPALAEVLGNLVSGAVGLVGVLGNVIAFFVQLAADVISAATVIVTGTIDAFGQLATMVSSIFSGIRTAAVNIWNGIKSGVSNVADGIRTSVANTIDAVRTNVVNVFNGIRTTATNVWDGIKTAIETPINAARDAVRGAIDAIRGFFNFKFQWPHIPLPHFSISGSANPLDWLTQGVPSISVEWYARGGIVDGATLIGAGERGPELITPLTNPHMRRYADAIARTVATSLDTRGGDAALLAELQALREDVSRLRLVAGYRELAVAMAPEMSRALERDARLRGYA